MNGYSAQFEFKVNPYSTYRQRCHFSPVWYPNGQYRVYTYVQDAWTPAGMLSMNLNDYVIFQDHYMMIGILPKAVKEDFEWTEIQT